MKNVRLISTWVLSTLFVFSLIACGEAEPKKSHIDEKREAIIGFPSPPDTLSPVEYRSARSSLIVERFLSLPLLERDVQSSNLIPALAAKLPELVGKAFRWTLRPEAKFADGTPLDSADIKRTIDFLKAGKFPGKQSDAVRGIRHVQVVSSHVFDLEFENAGYLDVERFGTTFAVLPGSFTSSTSDQPAAFSGCGPFILGLSNSTETILERNQEWWGDQCPDLRGRFDLDVLRLRYVVDQSSLPFLLKEGAIHLAPISGDQAKTFGGSRAKVERFQSTSFSFVGWNCKKGIASSAVARQVLGRLIPREKIASRSSSLQPHAGLFQTMNPHGRANVVTAAELKGIGLSDVTGNGKLEWQSRAFQLRVLLPTGKIPWAEETISAWRDVAAQRGLVLAVERLPVPILIDRLQAGDFDAFAIIWRVRHQ
ncbi:MAG: ABC-type transport system substrate-binding protein, partial [Planctomycetota bacterium]